MFGILNISPIAQTLGKERAHLAQTLADFAHLRAFAHRATGNVHAQNRTDMILVVGMDFAGPEYSGKKCHLGGIRAKTAAFHENFIDLGHFGKEFGQRAHGSVMPVQDQLAGSRMGIDHELVHIRQTPQPVAKLGPVADLDNGILRRQAIDLLRQERGFAKRGVGNHFGGH